MLRVLWTALRSNALQVFVAIGMAAIAVSPDTAVAQTLDKSCWYTNGNVRAIAARSNTIYIGGDFTYIGPPTGGAAALNALNGTIARPALRVTRVSEDGEISTGVVEAACPDGAGGWYIGGNFTAVGDEAHNNIAHILSDGTVSNWNPSVDYSVLVLALSGSTLYVGGFFNAVNGQPRTGLAAVDATTGALTPWDPSPEPDTGVDAMVVSGSTVYVGGYFSFIGGQSRNRIAALDATTGAATAWDPSANDGVQALAVSGSTVYAAGRFTSIGGQQRNRIAALDAITGAAAPWNPNANSTVYALAVKDSTVYAGGAFSDIGGQSRNYIAALSVSGFATPWNPSANFWVRTLAVNGSTVYAGGNFTSAGGQPRNHLVALDETSGAATTWNPACDLEWTTAQTEGVYVLAVNGSTVLAGGNFTSIGGQVRNHIAAIDASSGVATAWNPDSDGPPSATVSALVVNGSTVYVGGFFSTIGGQPRNSLAALDASTGAAMSWNPDVDGPVDALALSGSTVYAGGGFIHVGGQIHVALAAIDSTTAVARDLPIDLRGPGPAVVYALAVRGPRLYAGGTFKYFSHCSEPNCEPPQRNCLIALDVATDAVTQWDPSANGVVWALSTSGSTVYVGGGFQKINGAYNGMGNYLGGQSRNRIAAVDSTGAATGWNPNSDDAVRALSVGVSTLYAGGDFANIGGLSRAGFAALETSTGAATTWDPGMGSLGTTEGVFAVATDSSRRYVGGPFHRASGQWRKHFASWTEVDSSSVDVETPPVARPLRSHFKTLLPGVAYSP